MHVLPPHGQKLWLPRELLLLRDQRRVFNGRLELHQSRLCLFMVTRRGIRVELVLSVQDRLPRNLRVDTRAVWYLHQLDLDSTSRLLLWHRRWCHRCRWPCDIWWDFLLGHRWYRCKARRGHHRWPGLSQEHYYLQCSLNRSPHLLNFILWCYSVGCSRSSYCFYGFNSTVI